MRSSEKTTERGSNAATLGLVGLGGLAGLFAARRLFAADVETRPHAVGPDGLVEADLRGLARAAGASVPAYALASCMESEEGSDRGRLAVGRAVWNAARATPSRVLKLLVPRGRLGEQGAASNYASTSRPPTAKTLGLAQAILDGRVPDMVEGAVQWDSPGLQDKLHALYLSNPEKYPKYSKSSADVAAARVAAGAREVRLPKVPKTRFWTYA